MMPWQKRIISGQKKWKANKYGARKVMIGENVFDSAKEAARFKDLKQQEAVGFISNLELQPRFVLQEAFKHEGKTYRPIEYYADFRYEREGKVVIEDTKGYKTETYRIKKKMLLKKYPDINFRET